MEAQRLGDMAVTEGWAMLMQHLVTEPAWLNRRLDVPRVDELAQGRRRLAPLLRAALLREAPLRDRALPGRRPDDGAEPLRRAALGRAEDPGQLGELPRRRRRQLLRDRLPPLVGVRGAAARFPARRVRQRLVRAPRSGRSAPRALVGRPGADGGRTAEGRDRREARDGRGSRPNPRRAGRSKPIRGAARITRVPCSKPLVRRTP